MMSTVSVPPPTRRSLLAGDKSAGSSPWVSIGRSLMEVLRVRDCVATGVLVVVPVWETVLLHRVMVVDDVRVAIWEYVSRSNDLLCDGDDSKVTVVVYDCETYEVGVN